jgi:hypothetical protein
MCRVIRPSFCCSNWFLLLFGLCEGEGGERALC